MKLAITAFAFLFLYGKVDAQSLIENSMFPKAGETVAFYYCDTLNVTIDSGGTNLVFDYSELIKTGLSNIKYQSPDDTPGEQDFLISNCVMSFGNGLRYFKVTSDSLTELGDYIPAYNNWSVRYPSGARILSTSFEFDTLYIDTVVLEYRGESHNHYVVFNIKIDAIGKLILPDKTYEDVIRVKTIQSEHSVGYTHPTGNTTSYHFYTAGIGNYIMSIQYGRPYGSFYFKTFRIIDQITGIESLPVSEQIALGPNPFISTIYLNVPVEIKVSEFKLTNALGETVFISDYPDNTINLPENITNGIYFCLITTNKGIVTKKLVKEE